MPSFRAQVHLARDLQTGKLVSADRAIPKPGKGRYQCLDDRCRRSLTVARSKYGRLHFKHFRDGNLEGCRFHGHPKSRQQHTEAQLLLWVLFNEALQRKAPMPVLLFKTPSGEFPVLPFITGQQIVREWTCPLKHRRADLAILDRFGDPVLLIEVFHTHAVDGNKRLDLSPYWWIEVGARDVLENPFRLNVLDHGNLPYEFEILGHQAEFFDWALLPMLNLPSPERNARVG